jgi:sec-independent protein translocase protein TatC
MVKPEKPVEKTAEKAVRAAAKKPAEKSAERAVEKRAGQEVMEAQPLIVHLMALRRVLILSIGAVIIGFLFVFFMWGSSLVQWVSAPLEKEGVRLIYTEVSEAFGAQTRMSLIAGTVLGSPVIFGAVWWFVRPALHKHERTSAILYLGAALVLFVLGVVFAYRFVFFLAVNFFVTMGDGMASPMFSLGKYVDFLFSFLVPIGIMF